MCSELLNQSPNQTALGLRNSDRIMSECDSVLLFWQEGEPYNFKCNNPFIDSDDKEEAERVASVGYRYRQFDLGNDINMVVRCEVDAVMPLRAEEKEKREADAGPEVPKFCCIKALNEFDSRVSSTGLTRWGVRSRSHRLIPSYSGSIAMG